MYSVDKNVRKMIFIKDWFQKRTDYISSPYDPYIFFYKGSHSKYYKNKIVSQKPFSYSICVYVTYECVEVVAWIDDITEKNHIKELDREGDVFNLEFVQEENLNHIISYVQELDIKLEKRVKEYIIKYKLKNLENDFKK